MSFKQFWPFCTTRLNTVFMWSNRQVTHPGSSKLHSRVSPCCQPPVTHHPYVSLSPEFCPRNRLWQQDDSAPEAVTVNVYDAHGTFTHLSELKWTFKREHISPPATALNSLSFSHFTLKEQSSVSAVVLSEPNERSLFSGYLWRGGGEAVSTRGKGKGRGIAGLNKGNRLAFI